MKKRLRRKLRLGEFREYCFDLTFEMDPSLGIEQIDALTDSFIEMIEQNNLQYGGGGICNWQGIVEGPWQGSVTEADRETVLQWLRQQPEIVRSSAGPLRDAWHGWS